MIGAAPSPQSSTARREPRIPATTSRATRSAVTSRGDLTGSVEAGWTGELESENRSLRWAPSSEVQGWAPSSEVQGWAQSSEVQGWAQSSEVQGRATRRAEGVNSPALPAKRGRESPYGLSIMTPMGAERSRSTAGGSQSLPIRAALAAAACGALAAAGCGDSPPGRTFFERNIEPILLQKCAGNTSGCHSTNADDPYQFAAGNFDVTSFANVQKRRDLLAPFGAYAYPLLLIKAVPTGALPLYYDTKFPGIDPKVSPSRPLEVQHSGGPILDVNSDAFFTLQNWLQNGATENGLKPATPAQTGNGVVLGRHPARVLEGDLRQPDDPGQLRRVQGQRPAGADRARLHGRRTATARRSRTSTSRAGPPTTQLAFNFSQAWSFVNTPVDDSQILRVPLAVSAGGRGHTGGDQFSGTGDADYVAIRDLGDAGRRARLRQRRSGASSSSRTTSSRSCSRAAARSRPATARRRPTTSSCAAAPRGSSRRSRWRRTTSCCANDFMAIEFPDARRGRAVAKALRPSNARHRPPGSRTAEARCSRRRTQPATVQLRPR